MDWLTFISSMVDHLVWPIVVVGLLWFLFRNLEYLSEVFESIKFKDVEFNFRKDVKELTDKAVALNVTVRYPAEELANFGASPERDRQVVIENGNLIRDMLRGWADDQPEFTERSPIAILAKMKREGVIDERLFVLTRKVLAIRNKAVHAPSVALPPEEMSEFLGVSQSVKSRLEQAIRRV